MPEHFNYTDDRPTAVMDTECYPNYWSIAFRDVAGKRIKRFRQYNDSPLDKAGIAKIMRNWRVISFNGHSYDYPMIMLAMEGRTNAQLKQASDTIIGERLLPWQSRDRFGIIIPSWMDHIDLWDVSPGSPSKPSLKLYMARMHSKRIQELPFPIDTVLTDEQVLVLEGYHDNDLEGTLDFYLELMPQIRLRSIMSGEFNVDVRSKSDPQIAETVLKVELERLLGKKVYKPDVKAFKFRYKAPAYVKFKTPEMQEMLRLITTEYFVVDHAGKVHAPAFLSGLEMVLGQSVFRMGIGGLHSSEKAMRQVADELFALLDRDVTSYYPAIILLNKLFPPHLGEAFLKVYRKIFERRLQAKALAQACKDRGDSDGQRKWGDIAETLKIVLNGLFGKMGQPGSIVYAPDLMIQITITGQLSVLMMIEDLVLQGMEVVSANTDGWVTKVPRDRIDHFHAMIFDWECETGLGTEESEYVKLYSQGVNAYLGITPKGEAKRKGKNFTPAGPGQKGASGMKKNPFFEICAEAVINFLRDEKPLEETIEESSDIRKFVAVQRVNDGAEKDGVYLGRVLRWYQSTSTASAMHNTVNGNTVPRSHGAMPCADLPDEFPEDIDIAWYVREAYAALEDFGFDYPDPAFIGRSGNTMGRLDGQKTYHTIDMSTGIAVCGKKRKSIRDEWLEAKTVASGFRMCSKCIKSGGI